MRVLHVVTAFPRDEKDTIVPWLVTLITSLKEAGVEVEILAAAHKGGGSDEVFGVKVHRFRYAPAPMEVLSYEQAIPEQLKRKWPFFLVPPFLLGGLAKALWLSKGQAFDIVHVHWPLPCALFALPFRGTPKVFTFYTAEIALAEKFGILKPVFRKVLAPADALVFLTSYARERFERVFGPQPGKRVEIIPYMPSGEKRSAKRKPLRHRVLFVGRLVERKGVIYLIRAMKILLRRFPDARLVIVGDGPQRKALEAEAQRLGVSRSVEFRGFVSESEREEEYAKAHVFVLPAIVDSRGDTEGQGVVILEAMRAGAPVVASNVGGIPDLVIDGQTGILVPQKDPQALAEAIGRLFENDELAHALAANAKRHLQKNFSKEAVVKKTLNLYATLIQNFPPLRR